MKCSKPGCDAQIATSYCRDCGAPYYRRTESPKQYAESHSQFGVCPPVGLPPLTSAGRPHADSTVFYGIEHGYNELRPLFRDSWPIRIVGVKHDDPTARITTPTIDGREIVHILGLKHIPLQLLDGLDLDDGPMCNPSSGIVFDMKCDDRRGAIGIVWRRLL